MFLVYFKSKNQSSQLVSKGRITSLLIHKFVYKAVFHSINQLEYIILNHNKLFIQIEHDNDSCISITYYLLKPSSQK